MVESLFPFVSLSGLSSTNEFHCPQSGHRPIHFAVWYPQLWQTKTNLLCLPIKNLARSKLNYTSNNADTP
jgi:hypothetical protein